MAQAILKGLLTQGVSPSTLCVVDPSEHAHAQVSQMSITCHSTWPEHFAAEQIVLAVKPQLMQSVLEQHSSHLKNQLLISIAAGVSIEQIQRWSGQADHLESSRVVLAMPNTPAQVGQGLTGLTFTNACTAEDQREVSALFNGCGQTLVLKQEADINAITAISGSGPGYVFYLMEALEQAAKNMGFSAEQARLLTNQTFLGAATLANQSTDSLSELREKVTSKGGTTFAGLEVLQKQLVAHAIGEATQAALARAYSLQNEQNNQ